jgi:glycosyltransferase involved in cell wall biosynthesis
MSAPLNFVHIIPYYEPAWAYGGSPRVAVELCRRLAQRGHNVTVLTTDALDAQTRAPQGTHILDGVKVIRVRNLLNRLAWNRVFLPVGFGRVAGPFVSQADVVHIHEIRSLLNAAALPAVHSIPYIIMPHGGLPHDLGRGLYKRVFDMLWGKQIIGGACRCQALTKMEAEQWEGFGVPPERISLIPNGIDLGAFDIEVDLPAFRRRFELPADTPVVSFLGRLNAIKGLDDLIAAFAEVLETHPTAHLLMAGPDDGMRATLEAQIAHLGISEQVRFTGMLTSDADKAALYRISAVYVLPSRYENLPTTVLEALLNATPCIVSDRCGLAARLAKASAAAIVPSGDVDALARQIEAHLVHPASMRRRAERAQRWVRQNFDWETVTDRWEAVYRECAQSASMSR